jgi:hypothetical protein
MISCHALNDTSKVYSRTTFTQATTGNTNALFNRPELILDAGAIDPHRSASKQAYQEPAHDLPS